MKQKHVVQIKDFGGGRYSGDGRAAASSSNANELGKIMSQRKIARPEIARRLKRAEPGVDPTA